MEKQKREDDTVSIIIRLQGDKQHLSGDRIGSWRRGAITTRNRDVLRMKKGRRSLLARGLIRSVS